MAEASKVIENTQRDINIAFVNELSKIFHLLDIDTELSAVQTGAGWRSLHWCRPLLPDPESTGLRISSRSDPVWASYQ